MAVEYFFYDKATMQDVKDKTDVVWTYDKYGQPWFSMPEADGFISCCPNIDRSIKDWTPEMGLDFEFTLILWGGGPGPKVMGVIAEIVHKLEVRVADEETDEELYRVRCETGYDEAYYELELSKVSQYMDENGLWIGGPYDPADYRTTDEDRARWAADDAEEDDFIASLVDPEEDQWLYALVKDIPGVHIHQDDFLLGL